MEYTGALWHLDFHHGSRRVLDYSGNWVTPICLAIHDDHSRVCCHIQWLTRETCENLVHGLIQAILKRGLPRSIMTDNGSAMKADEFLGGLSRLGIIHDPCLPYSPYQNGKTERFWSTLEGKLMPMIPDGKDLDLATLNRYTLSWVEMGYNREVHRELGVSPIDRAASSHDVTRQSPEYDDLRQAFRARITRRQRKTDGTVTIDGTRYEVPLRWRHQESLVLHHARWEPSLVHLLDPQTDKILDRVYPCDKHLNADGRRRPIDKPMITDQAPTTDPAPLLRQYLEDFAINGLPLPYIPEASTEQL